ncbi:2-(3-amino-3-carboxypropyl)histidine synthase subunit 2-like isoform X2 [Schistocerca gregaria]|uniref:2-(3-amino-3-carboxypropyl)histidine synthase subunit 2-like isoform X2 n=1 Tax=Schistocerca gregaria TaxID=7010 RepID=UPI00211E82F4|nr:2-(3-amino-3-carboxypropyl)histidine synthase subunit 2-like isoform X2 [Schistocerca gregaria]
MSATSWIVALQFPDELLGDSSSVALHIKRSVSDYECRVFILADTSYGSCCVDEIAAEHVRADCLVHYGPACLSRTRRLPVLYVFGVRELDVRACGEAIEHQFGRDPVLVFYDVQYSRAIPALKERLSHLSEIVWTALRADEGDQDPSEEQRYSQFAGRTYRLPVGQVERDYRILFIGEDCPLLRNLFMTFNQSSVWSCSEGGRIQREGVNVNRVLAKRFCLVEKAKQASIFGIIVGTLAVENYLEVLQRLKRVIGRAGKKCYIFVVGKLNVPKLANFAEIDLFVLIACPESSLIDTTEYLRPCITPFELELALGEGKEWTGEYSCDYQRMMSTTEESGEGESGRSKGNGSACVYDVVRREEMSLCSAASHRTASSAFLERTFRGLTQELDEGQEAHRAVHGLSGIACEYEHETH